ncbi:NAD-binding protein, partial [Castellaniella sp.]|uniref:NAD-binding protein n=1 Tax=Castellaniella sp. TaxID=1955812 RepID=UPI003C7252AF
VYAEWVRAAAIDRATLMAQGGEFAFVLFAEALRLKVIGQTVNADMTAIIVLSMALTPLVGAVYKRYAQSEAGSLDGVETPQDLCGNALIIGFGRVGQIASQGPLARGTTLSIIDNDPDVIRNAARYGFKVYFGDGARADVLRAAGARHAQVILVCVDDPAAATRIVENARRECPQTRLVVRAFDREHALELIRLDADHVERETFEAALRMGHQAVLALGATDQEADDLTDDVRSRDAERFTLETAGGTFAGRALLLGNIERIDPPRHKRKPGAPLPPENV